MQSSIPIINNENTHTWTIHKERTSKKTRITWDHRPAPFLDEVFSSYVTRAAKANFAEPLEFLRILNPTKNPLQGDMDRVLKNESLQVIARVLGRDLEELNDMRVSNNFKEGVVLSGTRYCPLCLEEDGNTPYFRYGWRLSFISACTLHGCYLADECPHCGAPVRYWETKFDQAITDCSKCGGSILTAGQQMISIEPELRRDSQFNTFQGSLLRIFRTQRWMNKNLDRVNFFHKFWKLAWIIHKFAAQGEQPALDLDDVSWEFLKDVAISPLESFKAIFSAYKVLKDNPERLERPFVCPIEGRTFASMIDYTRHVRVHVVLRGAEPLIDPQMENGKRLHDDVSPHDRPVVREINGILQNLHLPQGYQTSILTSIKDFLARNPHQELFKHPTMRPGVIATGLTWLFGRYYGITQRKLASVLSLTKHMVFDRIDEFKNQAFKMRINVPGVPPDLCIKCLLYEVDQRYRLLTTAELDKLVTELCSLEIPWNDANFGRYITEFAECMYAYWAKSLGRTIPQKLGNCYVRPTIAAIRRQLASRGIHGKSKRMQIQIRESLNRIIAAGGFDPKTCAPLKPSDAFRDFLRVRCPQWHACTYSYVVAVLFLFVREKNPSCNISLFSGYLGLHASRVCSALKKLDLRTTSET